MTVSEIIQTVESSGCMLQVSNGRLNIKQGKRLEPSLVQWFKDNKTTVLEVLERDKSMKEIGFMVGVAGEIYMQSMSHRSIIYVECRQGKWVLWRENYEQGRTVAKRHKILAQGSFYEVQARASSYFNYLKGVSA
ncbi:hypothetical protein LF817_11370 [Halobacillus sp. A1]|uniref:hypothetical protein n=1 Tax=Halobacillus sp. A1 TaxID=2880262 RepID=UPI0020A621A1|nr:hypothetical protein [Halobacillus sp. A1]MCP3031945.1 hypothetical protein [Halobacillus sp. A1]